MVAGSFGVDTAVHSTGEASRPPANNRLIWFAETEACDVNLRQSLAEFASSGLTEADVAILHRGAKHFLNSGRCKQIEYADKSTSRPNTYYVNCGGPQNHFFKPSDLPRG